MMGGIRLGATYLSVPLHCFSSGRNQERLHDRYRLGDQG